jgi:outer membrane protein assembly factor BamE (lipoprotein component of BamABCDE complex)
MLRIVTLLMLLVVPIVGCGTMRSGREVSEAELANIVKGKTTKRELIELLGPPTQVSTKGDGTELLAYHSSVTSVSNPLMVVPIVGFFGSYKSETQVRQVIFTVRGGVVEEIETSAQQDTGCVGVFC